MVLKKVGRLKKTIMFFMTLSVLALSLLAFWLTWDHFYRNDMMIPLYRKGNYLIMGLYAVLLYIFTRLNGGYRVGSLRITEVVYSQILSHVFVNGITYVQISLMARRVMNPLPMIGMTLVQAAVATLWAFFGNRLYFRLYPPKKLILIYQKKQAFSIFAKMNSRSDKFNITETFRYDGNLEKTCRYLEQFEGVVLSGIPIYDRNKLLRHCYKSDIRVYVVPDITDILLSSSDRIHLFDTPLMLMRNRGLTLESRFAKRVLDLAFSSLAIVVTSPLMLMTALAVKLYDGGPVLFKQTRLTRGRREFQVYKFRSMVTDAEGDGVARLATQNDDRITPVGRLIRKVRLDELPQLFNIFLGDMSIVGPRPERPEIAAQYEKYMPEFNYRLKVKAGLTGYAQILGKYNTTPRDKLLLDLIYIENYSIFLDLKLILMTIKILFLPESTEGIDDGTLLAEEKVEEPLH